MDMSLGGRRDLTTKSYHEAHDETVRAKTRPGMQSYGIEYSKATLNQKYVAAGLARSIQNAIQCRTTQIALVLEIHMSHYTGYLQIHSLDIYLLDAQRQTT